ncbi:hypothetical protein QFC22_003944 [Naganishia vaughanmartiniae]|uniref:Uncharacterized protein n=1 Tax=Naganishia vaughanmartiniae TaxID=1424756 RepID=A0ACC2X4M7_9TREE|nr:hypothetical protein QFC22_003944 [Naganishia vaughanmartiniae]
MQSSQNPLSPTNMIKPLPAQQSLQPPSSRDRQDSQSSQGSGSASGGSGSRAPSYRTARGSEDRSAAPMIQPGTQQDRGMPYMESRRSPSPAPQQSIQQNYSMQPQPQHQHQLSYQSSADYAPSQPQQQHSRVASNTSASSRHVPQALSGLPQSDSQRTLTQAQGLETPTPFTHSPSPSYGEQRGAQPSPPGRLPAAQQGHAEQRPVAPSTGGAGQAQENSRDLSQIPSPPPEMMVEPPTPIPGGDVATMESMQDVASKEGRGMAHDSPIPAGYRMDGKNPVPPSRDPAQNDSKSGTNATKQRARLPQIVTTTPGPSTEQKASRTLDPPPAASNLESASLQPIDRRAHIRRASIHQPAQTSTGYSRDVLLRSSFAVTGTAAALLDDSAQGEKALEDETLANVEELLEGFDWGTISLPGRGEPAAASATEVFERRLLDELNALEAVRVVVQENAALKVSDHRMTIFLGEYSRFPRER